MSHITKEEYFQLEGLLTLARYHTQQIRDIEKAAYEITCEEEGGHTSDAMYEGYTAKGLLSKLKLRVR